MGTEWEPNLGKLALTDSGIPLSLLEPLKSLTLTPAQQELLDRTLQKIKKREANTKLSAELIAATGPRLELAAWCDLNCNQHEGTMVRWAIDSLSKFKNEPLMKQEPQRLKNEYQPTDIPEQPIITAEMQQKRVNHYLQKLLSPDEEPIKARLQ